MYRFRQNLYEFIDNHKIYDKIIYIYKLYQNFIDERDNINKEESL